MSRGFRSALNPSSLLLVLGINNPSFYLTLLQWMSLRGSPCFEKLTLVLQLKIMESFIGDHGGDVEKSTGSET